MEPAGDRFTPPWSAGWRFPVPISGTAVVKTKFPRPRIIRPVENRPTAHAPSHALRASKRLPAISFAESHFEDRVCESKRCAFRKIAKPYTWRQPPNNGPANNDQCAQPPENKSEARQGSDSYSVDIRTKVNGDKRLGLDTRPESKCPNCDCTATSENKNCNDDEAGGFGGLLHCLQKRSHSHVILEPGSAFVAWSPVRNVPRPRHRRRSSRPNATLIVEPIVWGKMWGKSGCQKNRPNKNNIMNRLYGSMYRIDRIARADQRPR